MLKKHANPKTKQTIETIQVTRHMTGIGISTDGEVSIEFTELRPGEVLKGNGTEEELEDDEKDAPIGYKYTLGSPRYPHKDFIDAMKKLRKHALAICEMEYGDSKQLAKYEVIKVKIAGDVTLRQSRVVMKVAKLVDRTEKYIKWTTPQVTMYGESKYEDAPDLAKLVEHLILEANAYMNGKSQEEDQLPLFPSKQELMAKSA